MQQISFSAPHTLYSWIKGPTSNWEGRKGEWRGGEKKIGKGEEREGGGKEEKVREKGVEGDRGGEAREVRGWCPHFLKS